MKYYKLLIVLCIISLTCLHSCYAQTETEAWGNLKGIRIEGQLINFESAIAVINSDNSKIIETGKERQRPKYTREGNKQIIKTNIDSFYFVEQIEDISKGNVKVSVQFTSKKDTTLSDLYFHLKLPDDIYGQSSLRIIEPQQNALPAYDLTAKQVDHAFTSSGIKFTGAQKQLEIIFNEPTKLKVIKSGNRPEQYIHVYIPIQTGTFSTGQTGEKIISFKASGKIDKAPVTVQLDPKNTGRVFAGFGGNFRLQNPKADPQVIDYCLNNMRVAWSRVEMPWMLWQRDENSNPVDSAKAGKLHPHVKESMEMAQRLSKMNIPVIVSAWFPPQWAVTGEIRLRRQPGDPWGNPLNQDKTQAIYKSLTEYIIYLKDAYGVEVSMFSFNESDLGINVRQTGEEHAKLIKELGAYMQSRGLKTKMLLGDNSDATTYEFIYPAMKDKATHPYIGAVSFHSWRGWDTETLQKWADAAKQMSLPLIIGEGSIDAAAWNYPQIFEEQTYALEEINLYTRLLNICQPLSILQWQLTSDYSPLVGGGIFGDNSSLRPTQRFWNLKQLASIPANVAAITVSADRSEITCAAQADESKNIYVVHLVNNDASRTAILKGLPKEIKKVSIYVTSKTKNMQEENPVEVINGQAKILLDAVSYTTVISE